MELNRATMSPIGLEWPASSWDTAAAAGRQIGPGAASYQGMLMPLLIRGSAVVLLFSLHLTGCRQEPLTLDDLIERNVQAVGGRASIEAVRSIRFDLHIMDPGFEVDGIYRAARPGWMRIDVSAEGQRVFTEALGENGAWQWKGKGEPVEATAKATAALRHGVDLPGHLFGLHELRARGHRIELAGREQVERINYHLLRVTFADGDTTTLYLDADSWLITRRRDVRPLHPDVDPTPTTIENKVSDFRKVGDLLFAFTSTDTDLRSGKVLEKVAVRSITLNPAVDPTVFTKL